MKSFYYKIIADNISLDIRQVLRDYFASKTSDNDVLALSFDNEKFTQEINFKELLFEVCNSNEYEYGFKDFADYLNGKNDKFKLVMSFDKAIFDIYPNFDGLRCHKLSFNNTVFEKGARFRHIDVDEVLFEPRRLDADATFFHRKKADIDAGILRGKEIGKIGRFKYRHQLEGDGTTFLIGMRFTERAEFTDCVLDKVQFSYLDENSLSKCYFANSIIGKARFYNCTFHFSPNFITAFRFIENKQKVLAYSALFATPIVIIGLLFFVGSMIEVIFYIFLIMLPFMVVLGGSIFNTSYFMPLMKLLEKIIDSILELQINRHITTADDSIATQNISPEQNKINRETVREIYRQLKISYSESGDYQKAGEFYYSQRYWETVGDGKGFYGFFSSQQLLMDIHHWVNGFGERWLRAFVWFLLTIFGFAFFAYTPNEDFISTKSTPEYFLNAYNDGDKNKTSKIAFNTDKKTGKIENVNSSHFMEIATTNYKDSSVEYIKDKNKSIVAKQTKDINKTFYAFDNRFDFYYTSQFIPVLKTENNFDLELTHSLSKMIAPFISEEKKWFQDRSQNAYYLGFLETILLWIFFLAFVFAVKNRIRR